MACLAASWRPLAIHQTGEFLIAPHVQSIPPSPGWAVGCLWLASQGLDYCQDADSVAP